MREVILVCRHAPTMIVAEPRHVLTALHHQGVLGVDQGTFDLRRRCRPKSVQPAHPMQPLLTYLAAHRLARARGHMARKFAKLSSEFREDDAVPGRGFYGWHYACGPTTWHAPARSRIASTIRPTRTCFGLRQHPWRECQSVRDSSSTSIRAILQPTRMGSSGNVWPAPRRGSSLACGIPPRIGIHCHEPHGCNRGSIRGRGAGDGTAWR